MDVAHVRREVVASLNQAGYSVDPMVAGGDRFRPRESEHNVYIEVGTSMNEVRVRFYSRGRLYQRMDVISERHLTEDLKAIRDTAKAYRIGTSGMPQ